MKYINILPKYSTNENNDYGNSDINNDNNHNNNDHDHTNNTIGDENTEFMQQ